MAKATISDLIAKLLVPLLILSVVGTIIWIAGPQLTWGNTTPLLYPEKRIYIILILFLLWLLKILLFGFNKSKKPIDKESRTKLQALQNQFSGALQFLKKTALPGNNIYLNELPWYLIIGPSGAGKTALLANSNINFILKRQLHKTNNLHFEPSDNCDWWITKKATFVDVPGYFLATERHLSLWQCLLTLIKKNRGNLGLNGIIIAIPLPEIMQKADHKTYLMLMQQIIQRVDFLQKIISQPIPCTLVITKCDLLPGFNEFFAELSIEEVNQAWGISFATNHPPSALENIILQHFNMLIKKLNEQLITRLHQERNPMMRPFIKDFPLQVERVKSGAIDVIKKCIKARLNLKWQGIYLTSALQDYRNDHPHIEQPIIHANPGTLQIYQGPPHTTRTYFVNQLLNIGFKENKFSKKMTSPSGKAQQWRRRAIYAASFSVVAFSAYFLGQDFNKGIHETRSIQKYIIAYQQAMSQTKNLNEKIVHTVVLLDSLHDAIKTTTFKIDLKHLNAYYSTHSQQKVHHVYQRVLQTILLPEIREYLEEYLKIPINRDTADIYAVLKIYLMLGNAKQMKTDYFLQTLKHVLPIADRRQQEHLFNHLTMALMTSWQPLHLNENVIQQTRKFLTSIPNLQLGYIILTNNNDNTGLIKINLGTSGDPMNIFEENESPLFIMNMYTAQAFNNIVAQEINMAAEEAILGNWVLGNDFAAKTNPDGATVLIDQLRVAYVTNYIDVWENLLKSIHLIKPKSLDELDRMIVKLTSINSPLLQLLKTFHDNTYFEPIISTSPKLQNLGLFYDKTEPKPDIALTHVFAVLRGVHEYLQTVLSAKNSRKASFDILANRMLHQETPDALTQLRLVADKSPEPLKSWLEKISDNALNFLMKDASHYMDTSWQENVLTPYKNEIANHYPFTTTRNKAEVKLQQFSNFFGNPGTMVNFYKQYLQAFIKTDNPDWHWKSMDNTKLPFSEASLQQIQKAFAIHQAFFPKDDKNPAIQLTLQPYKIDKNIKKVSLNFDDKEFIDTRGNTLESHVFVWPSTKPMHKSTIQLTLENKKIVEHEFTGAWSWLKLVDQSFDSLITNKEMLINLSEKEFPVKYVVLADGQFDPTLALNLHDFNLPNKISATDLNS